VIIHRDLKPTNMLVSLRGDVTVRRCRKLSTLASPSGHAARPARRPRIYTQFGAKSSARRLHVAGNRRDSGSLDIDTRRDRPIRWGVPACTQNCSPGKPPFDSKDSSALGVDEMRRVIQ
jgi:serine/threonine protein kinase